MIKLQTKKTIMQIRWCWRCGMDIPMLDSDEFALCHMAKENGRKFVELEIKNRKLAKYEWLGEIPISYEKFRYFIDMYRVITGFPETNPNAIFHHFINNLGPIALPVKNHYEKKSEILCKLWIW